MSQAAGANPSHGQMRADVVRRLRDRRSEIEEVIFAGVRAVSDPLDGGDAEYLAGLRATVAAVVDYGLTGIEHGHDWSGPIPSVAVTQAQLAARYGVGLDTVLLRYAAGQRHLESFVLVETEHLPNQALRHVLDVQWSLHERLITAVSAEYSNELARSRSSLDQRRGKRVQKLLAGESINLDEFDYEFNEAWHLGMIVMGARAHEAIRRLASDSGRKLLPVVRGEETIWAWLGAESRIAFADLPLPSSATATRGVQVAIGEPAQGLQGWRLTHHQAQAASLVALHRHQTVTRYGEDMLLAAALRDETLARSLEAIYLAPLADQRDGGAIARETLRSYFEARSNAATAAVALGVDRHTVERRLRGIERSIGRLLHTCQPEMEVALRLFVLRTVANTDCPSPIRRVPRMP